MTAPACNRKERAARQAAGRRHLSAGVGVFAQLHVLPPHQAVQADEADVQALHTALSAHIEGLAQ